MVFKAGIIEVGRVFLRLASIIPVLLGICPGGGFFPGGAAFCAAGGKPCWCLGLREWSSFGQFEEKPRSGYATGCKTVLKYSVIHK